MIDLLSNTQFPVTCPSCKNTFSKRFRELETKAEIACPKCHAAVPLDRESFKVMRKGQGKMF
jgi:ribosomal protein L37AE/L43A